MVHRHAQPNVGLGPGSDRETSSAFARTNFNPDFANAGAQRTRCHQVMDVISASL
jgi:hypothetical protein